MNATLLLRLAWPDILERARRSGFLLAVGTTVWLGSLVYTQNIQMWVGDYRGVVNSAWLGTVMALSATTFVSLAGFYMVKNAVARDRETGVGQILAATRVSTPAYLLAKWLSNVAVLSAIVVVLAMAAVILHFALAGAVRLDLPALLAPFALLALPAMAVVAACAVLFETVPALSGGAGNVAYFFVWNAALAIPLVTHTRWLDWGGLSFVETSLAQAVHAHAPGAAAGISFTAGPAKDLSHLAALEWAGIEWTWATVALRLSWVAVSAAIALGPAFWFDRFDAVAAGARPPKKGWPPAEAPGRRRFGEARSVVTARAWQAIARVISLRTRFGAMVAAELRLAFSGVSGWWPVVAAGLWMTSLAAPIDAARYALVAAWIWPLLLWSDMGVRESRHRTDQLVFSCPRPLARQFVAVWTAGVVIALVTGSGLAVRFALAGDATSLGAWVAGALFAPSLALALGVWTGSSRTFEALYTVWWYIGPVSHFAPLDFSGAWPAGADASRTASYLVLSALLFVIAGVGRRRQVRG